MTQKTKNPFDALSDFENNHNGFPKGAISAMECIIIRTDIKSKCEIKVGPFFSIDDKSVCTSFRKGDNEIYVSVSSRFIKIYERNYIGGDKCIKRVGKTHTASAAHFIYEYLNK